MQGFLRKIICGVDYERSFQSVDKINLNILIRIRQDTFYDLYSFKCKFFDFLFWMTYIKTKYAW